MKHNYPVPTASPFADFKQYIPLILAAINYELDTPYAWSATDRETALDYVQELIRWFVEWDDTSVPISTTREDYTHWHVNAVNDVGNGVALTIQPSQIFNHAAFQSASASTDIWFSQDFWLAGGHQYVADCYAIKSAASGIMTLELRDADTDELIASVVQDLYAATTTFNVKVQMSFTLTADRHLRFQGKPATKNASSSGYNQIISCIMVRH